MGVGGRAKQFASKAYQLRDSIISDLHKAFLNDKEQLENIEKADFYHEDSMRMFSLPVFAKMLRQNSPIRQEETLPSILSEDPLSISLFIKLLPENDKIKIQEELLKMIREVSGGGYIDSQFEEKISAINGNRI